MSYVIGKRCQEVPRAAGVWHLRSSVRAELNVFNNYDERYSSPTYQHTHTHTHTQINFLKFRKTVKFVKVPHFY